MDTIQATFKITNETSDMLEMSGLVQSVPQSHRINSDFVVDTLVNFLQKIKVNDEIVFNMPDDIAYSESWTNAMRIINMESTISYILENMFIRDFTINDIINPNAKRINRILRYLSNYIIYTDSKRTEIDERHDLMIEEVNVNKKTVAEIENYQIRTAEMVNKMEYMIKEDEKLIKEIEEKKELLEEKSKRRLELVGVLNELKSKHNKNKEDVTKRKEELRQIEECKIEMAKQVVKSPSKIEVEQKQINIRTEEKKVLWQNLKETLAEKKKSRQEIKINLEKLEQLLNKCRECAELNKKCCEGLENAARISKELDDLKNLIEKEKRDELDERHLIRNGDSNLEVLKAECEQKLGELVEHLSNVTSELHKKEEELQMVKCETQKVLSGQEREKSLIKQLENEIEIFMKECHEKYEREVVGILKKQEELEKMLLME